MPSSFITTVDAAGLNAPFPLARIAAAVKTGDDQKAIRLGEEKQRVGKSLGARPPQCFVDHGKLPGVVGHALDHAVDLSTKAPA
jgi:hypothetical protein